MQITTSSFTLAVYQKGDKNAERLALVLPGRLDTKDYVNMRSHVDFLAAEGYLAVSFDPPGTWESPGSLELFTTTNYIKAAHELIAYFGTRASVLLGHSRGGTVSVLVGTAHPAVIAMVPIMATYGAPSKPKAESFQSGFEVSYRDVPPGDHESEEQRKFELPIAYFEDGAKYDVGAALRVCRKPILLIYGTDDDFTASQKVQEVFETIPAGKKRIHAIECDHDYRYRAECIKEVNKVMGEFLRTV